MITAVERRPIFVYGTLRPGQGNTWAWDGRATACRDGGCCVIGYALVSNGGFPYLVRAATGQTVGCLIVPDDDAYAVVLRRIDSLEGYVAGSVHNHYERVVVPVICGNEVVSAWTYVPSDDRDVAGLRDVAVNAGGFYDWCADRAARH